MIHHIKKHHWLLTGASVLSLMAASTAPAGTSEDFTDDTIGFRNDTTGKFLLKNENTGGKADVKYGFGPKQQGFTPIKGAFGPAGAGCSIDTNGVYNPGTGKFFLRDELAAGPADEKFNFLDGGSLIAFMGDWNNDGVDTPGLYDPTTGEWSLRNSNDDGEPDEVFSFGQAGGESVPIVGDWDGQNGDSIGFYLPSNQKFKLRNTNSNGGADESFSFGFPNSTPITGDWDADGIDEVGTVRDTGKILLRFENAGGGADHKFSFGAPGPTITYFSGDWNCS